MTKAQAAEYLGMSERTLQRRHSEGVGPPRVKIGGKIFYFEESLIRWLKAQEKEPVRLKC
ncbi:helix-turn-helix transcriptional regulator [Nioella sp. MMSF_3534]|uniref:helix-turn-helix transcriptional regulator n=1 Tax=Nioella sp. MMSF_3534 TaxID=3046720 RepID=UPI0035318D5B